MPCKRKSMKQKLLSSLFFLSFFSALFAQRNAIKSNVFVPAPVNVPQQRTCGTQTPSAEWDAWFNQRVQEFIANQPVEQGKLSSMPSYTIPVVVHVIHNGEAVGSGTNISQTQVNSQINVLNADYAGTGLNVGNVPSAFSALVANCQITFCLAQKDPSGNVLAQPGIHRVNRNTAGFTAPPYSNTTYIDNTIKPATIWNPANYLNMWVLNLGGGLLGYATFPGGTGLTGLSGFGTATTDGVVILYSAFGNTGTVSAPYNKGRTATHEVGHWLGLRHIWGDSNCGSDFCADTPTQQTANYGCPTYPQVTCSNSGDMSMNFMDYTDDACMYMFTPNQKTRVQTAMANGTYRSNLTNSSNTVCNSTPTAPTSSFNFSNPVCSGTAKQFTDASSGTPTSWQWSVAPNTGVTITTPTSQSPTITFGNTGTYTVTLNVTNAQGSNSSNQVVTVQNCTTGGTSTCPDTLNNFTSFDTLTIYRAGADVNTAGCSPNAGYVIGNNCYKDKEKAEWYSVSKYSGLTSPQITGVMVLFYKNGTQGTGGATNSACNMRIYNGTLAGGPTGTALATVNATLGNITGTAAVNTVNYAGDPSVVYTNNIIIPYKYQLTTPLTPPATNGFFASVVLPTGNTDTAVIFNDIDGSDSTTWEKWSNNTWYSVNTAWGGLPLSSAIMPILSCSITTGIANENDLNNFITVFPNPNNGHFNFAVNFNETKDLTCTVYNTLGQTISSRLFKGVTNNLLEFNVSDYGPGVYFIHANTSDNKTAVFKVIVK